MFVYISLFVYGARSIDLYMYTYFKHSLLFLRVFQCGMDVTFISSCNLSLMKDSGDICNVRARRRISMLHHYENLVLQKNSREEIWEELRSHLWNVQIE